MLQRMYSNEQTPHNPYFDPHSYSNPLPHLPQWDPAFSGPDWGASQQQITYHTTNQMPTQQMYTDFENPSFDLNGQAYMFPGTLDPNANVNAEWINQAWDVEPGVFGDGLNFDQQQELMHSLETDGMEDIQSMITNTIFATTPTQPYPPTL